MIGKQKITALMAIAMMLLFPFSGFAESTPYAVFDSSTGTLTLKYGDKSSDSGSDVCEFDEYSNRGWDQYCSDIKKVVFEESFKNARPEKCSDWFYQCNKLVEIEGIENLNTSEVTDMSNMFWGCSSLTAIDVSGFNTENVENMSGMFFYCSKLTELNLSNFDTKNVTNMSWMFTGCSSLACILDFSKFNTANVTNMNNMFTGCSLLTQLNLASFDTQQVTNMENMFEGCNKLSNLVISSFNTGEVTNMKGMFSRCYALTSLNLSNFDTHKVENMNAMFNNCSSLLSINLSSFNTENVTDMSYMFSQCPSLTELNISNFNSANVENIARMFDGSSSLETLDLSNFDTKNVTDLTGMFNGCTALKSINLSKFDTRNVIYMDDIFEGCKALTALNLSSFNTENVLSMRGMFGNCINIKTIYVSDKFVTENVKFSEDMFESCTSLEGAIAYDANKIDKEAANYKNGYFKTYIKIGDTITEICGSDEANYTVASLDFTDKDVLSNVPIKVKDKITYNLNMANEWGTICLPYEVTYSANAEYKLYKLSDLKGDVLIFTEYANGAEIPAGTPMAIRHITESATVSVTTEKAEIPLDFNSSNMSGGGWRLVGTYTKVEVPDEGYIISNNKFWNVGRMKLEGHNVKSVAATPYHAYIMPASSASSAASKLSIGFGDDETTAIDSPAIIDVFNPNAEYYDINGRRIKTLEKGINIVKMGGKTTKVIIK